MCLRASRRFGGEARRAALPPPPAHFLRYINVTILLNHVLLLSVTVSCALCLCPVVICFVPRRSTSIWTQ